MIRGTTPTHVYTLPFDVEKVRKLRIIYSQSGNEKVVKTEAHCTLAGNTATVRLTQEDTLAFSSDDFVLIQLRVLTPEGDALASNVMRVKPGVCLEDEVIG